MVLEMPPDPCKIPTNRPFVESDIDSDSESYTLQNFKLYQTQAKFYLFGRDKSKLRWRVLKIDRLEHAKLIIYEDPSIYTREDCDDILYRLKEGHRRTGDFSFVTKAYGIIGFIKFLDSYYMVLVTKRRIVGNICGHVIYGIDESKLITVQHSSVHTDLIYSKEERRYKKLFCSINLTKSFFFSYTYRLMWTLQKNFNMRKFGKTPYEDMFVWNAFLTRGIHQQAQSMKWTVALVHGFFKQEKHNAFKNLNIIVTLIARRSRYFAGTRYYKRGLNDEGRVANDVETEQIVFNESSGDSRQISSVVQHRGSIPLHWCQKTSVFIPKPDIEVHKNDPKYEATRLHFKNLSARYGNPTIVLNLVKANEKKPRETVVSNKFQSAIEYLNSLLPLEEQIQYIGLDFHTLEKRTDPNILKDLRAKADDVLRKIGFYCLRKKKFPEGNNNLDIMDCHLRKDQMFFEQEDSVTSKQDMDPLIEVMNQKGVLRSNCIDCIDRTNAMQYEFGLVALGHQMFSLGLSCSPDITEDVATVFRQMYLEMGDALAMQYAGSTAHNKILSQRPVRCSLATRILKIIQSITRYYTNVFQDGDKQDAINILLGDYQPEVGKVPPWEFDANCRLQVRRFGEYSLNKNRFEEENMFSSCATLPSLFGYSDNETEIAEIDGCDFLSTSGGSCEGSVSFRHSCDSETDNECDTSQQREFEETLLR